MKITAGTQVIENARLYSEKAWEQGAARPTLRVVLTGGITDAQIDALKQNSWSVSGDVQIDSEEEAHVWSGYNELLRHEIVFARIDSLAEVESERDAAVAQAAKAQAEVQQGRDAAKAIIPLIADNAGAINTALPLIGEWSEGAYAIGDVVAYNGAPYKCVQAHDSTGNASWNPSVASLWIQYHGTGADTARAWVAPTGAHDMYKAGEYMVYTDGQVYKCLSDTAYSPTDYAAAWSDGAND